MGSHTSLDTIFNENKKTAGQKQRKRGVQMAALHCLQGGGSSVSTGFGSGGGIAATFAARSRSSAKANSLRYQIL